MVHGRVTFIELLPIILVEKCPSDDGWLGSGSGLGLELELELELEFELEFELELELELELGSC